MKIFSFKFFILFGSHSGYMMFKKASNNNIKRKNFCFLTCIVCLREQEIDQSNTQIHPCGSLQPCRITRQSVL